MNNGAQVTVTDNCLVGVLGSMQNGTVGGLVGDIDNAGYVWIDGDVINLPAQNITGLDAASINSTFVVRGDWNNSGNFTAFQNTVELDTSLEQAITGASITTFHNLYLKGSNQYNVKRQTIDAVIDATGELRVLDAELATDNSLMQVLNTNSLAVTHNDGIVSSLGDAYISWVMNSTDTYEFPVGSSLGTFRKRVARLSPGTGNPNIMGVRFANVDATTEGYDRSIKELEICEINPFFYHRLYQLNGADDMDIDLQYIPALDGDWTYMVNWENSPAREWSITDGSVAGATFVSVDDWTAFTDTAFAFGTELAGELTAFPTTLCPGDPATLTLTNLAGDPTLSWNQPGLPSTYTGPITVTPTQTTEYIVTISNGICEINDTALIVVVSESIDISIGPDVFVCQGEPAVFFASTSGSDPNAVISWNVNGVTQIGENADSFILVNASNGDIVTADYTSSATCIDPASSNPIVVATSAALSVEITGEDFICVPQGQSVPLFATVTAPDGTNIEITWTSEAELTCQLGCEATFVTPIIGDSVWVIVTATDLISGCSASDSVLICATDLPGIYIPTAFTPDGDTDNDVVYLLGDLDEYDLKLFRIYNRWGELVFETNDFSIGWDGTYKKTAQEMDVYVYYVKATIRETLVDQVLKGNLALLR